MKVAIIGTRGIPNHYGGFEQFAEYLSLGLTQKGHEVYVYNSHQHPYQENTWKGVNIIHKFDPENKIGTAGQFIYDFNCILDSRKRKFDIILQLGYTSSSIWGRILPSKSIIVTNMDGLEWKRTKFSARVQKFLHYAEKLAIKTSDHLVADSIGIQSYLKESYNVDSTYIAYGSHLVTNYNEATLLAYDLKPYEYLMLIARLEPENNIETILDGYTQSGESKPFLVVGNHKTKYGEYLKNKFKDNSGIQFLGGIYDINKLNDLRYYTHLYFHGHTVGGTNPSLLEAMGSGALICAHKNLFNQSILNDDALYFNSSNEIATIIQSKIEENRKTFVQNNFYKIENLYNWERITNQYLDLFKSLKK